MKNIYLSIFSKITSFSISTFTLIFAVILLVSVNIATLLSATFYDLLYSGLARIIPTEWVANSYSSKNRANQKKIKTLSTKNKNLVSKNTALQNKNLRIKTKVSKAVKSIQRRTKTLATATIAEMPAEAVPFLGAAAIVGSAIYEVHAACSTMKDLHELDIEFNPENQFDNTVCGISVPTVNELKQGWSDKWQEIFLEFDNWLKE